MTNAYGEANYEIAYLSRQKDELAIGFKLVSIPPTSLTQHNGIFYQYLPRQLADFRKETQYIQLSEYNLLRFQVPDYIRNELKYVLKSLSGLSNHPTLPDFALRNISDNSTRIPFDIAAFDYSRNLALADAAKQIGWNSFTPIGNNMLEYYYFHRFLLFEQFKVNLRNSILSTLNEGLSTIGKRLEFSARLEIEGLPSIGDVNAAQSRLSSGNISFNELLDLFSLL